MVQLLLNTLLLLLLIAPGFGKSKPKSTTVTAPELLMDGGRKLTFERSFRWERDVKPKKAFWTKVIDFVAGEPSYRSMVRPYSVVADSRGRVIVTDPGAFGVHIFDFEQQKYKFLSRREGKEAMNSPQCVAVDRQDNIYVTDSDAGKIFVFNGNGKFQRAIGSIKGGEGFFKRPTGIAIDADAQRIYVSDTWRNKIYVMDMNGSVVQVIGKKGVGNGEFNFPTELRLHGDDLIVADAMNFRVQVLNKNGVFRYSIGNPTDEHAQLFRPKGIGVDSENHIYVVEGLANLVEVFDEQGRLLYYFGQKGSGLGDFQLPAGLFIDRNDRIFVVDSFNRRAEIFHYFGLSAHQEGGTR